MRKATSTTQLIPSVRPFVNNLCVGYPNPLLTIHKIIEHKTTLAFLMPCIPMTDLFPCTAAGHFIGQPAVCPTRSSRTALDLV